MYFVKTTLVIFFLLTFISIGYSDSLTLTPTPSQVFDLPTGSETNFDLLELNFTAFDFQYNASSNNWLYMDGCNDDYSTQGSWEVTNYSCLSTDFLNKTNLLDKTIVQVIHAFNTGGNKDTMSAILARDDDGYYHAYLQFAEAPQASGTKFFFYIPHMEQQFTSDATAYYRINNNFLHTPKQSKESLTTWRKWDAPENYNFIAWNSLTNTLVYPEYLCENSFAQCSGGGNQFHGLKIGNATFAWSIGTIQINTFSGQGYVNIGSVGANAGGLYLYMDNGSTTDKRIQLDSDGWTKLALCNEVGGTACIYNLAPQFDITNQYYKVINGTITATYLDTAGSGIDGGVCNASRTNPYASSAQSTSPYSTHYDEDIIMTNEGNGIYTAPFEYDGNIEKPFEGRYNYSITCSKATYATITKTLAVWVGESGGYFDENRFRVVSMEGIFDTVSAYDSDGDLLDISTLTKKQEIDQVLFKIWERDNGFINNQMFEYDEDIQERHDTYKDSEEYQEYIDPAKDHYAVALRLFSDDFFCNANDLSYNINPASDFTGSIPFRSLNSYASIMHIGGASFGYSATQARSTFCVGEWSFVAPFVNFLPPLHAQYREPLNYCEGFKCNEPSKVFLEIMICDDGSISDCDSPNFIPLTTFEFGFGNMEFLYPQVININATSQQFYGRLYDASRNAPMVLEDINCSVNLTGSDSTTINVGTLERGGFDALLKDFTPTGAQYNASQYPYNLYCSGADEFYNPLSQNGTVYVGDVILGQSRCEVIPNHFKPNTYVTTACELASIDARTYSLGNFSIQYDLSVGNLSVIQNMTESTRTDILIWEYKDLNYYRNETTTGLEPVEDGFYNVTIWGVDNNGNYPSFNRTMPIHIDSNVVDVSEYLVSVRDNVPSRDFFQSGDNYTCTVVWKDPDKQLYKADVEIGTVSDTGDIYSHVFLYSTYYQRGWDLPFELPVDTLTDIYDQARYDLRTDTYSLSYNLYYPLDTCDERGTYKVYNASAFDYEEEFIDDVCEYFPLREHDTIRCTWTMEFGSNLSSVGGSKFVETPFLRIGTVDLWGLFTQMMDRSGIGKLGNDLVDFLKANILGFLLFIILVVIIAIVLTGRGEPDFE